MIDQECLEKKVEEWKTADSTLNVYFRAKIDSCEKKETFLFVHQKKWQRDLLQRYGNEILLLDATYKTTQHALPISFLVVPTNINYQIVASFVIENESKDSIIEAINVVKSWNPSL